jgi:hypothetical protein
MNRPQDLRQFSALIAFDNGKQITVTDDVFEFEQALTLVARAVAEFLGDSKSAFGALPTVLFLVVGTETYHYAGADEILDQLAIDA